MNDTPNHKIIHAPRSEAYKKFCRTCEFLKSYEDDNYSNSFGVWCGKNTRFICYVGYDKLESRIPTVYSKWFEIPEQCPYILEMVYLAEQANASQSGESVL